MTAKPQWRARIHTDAGIHHGDPCMAGTRIPVSVIVGSIADGDSFAHILAAYPALTREDIQAALWFPADSHDTMMSS